MVRKKVENMIFGIRSWEICKIKNILCNFSGRINGIHLHFILSSTNSQYFTNVKQQKNFKIHIGGPGEMDIKMFQREREIIV